jgi:predicted dehydrogenase
VIDVDAARAIEVASMYGAAARTDVCDLARHAQAAIIASPTSTHAEIGCHLLEAGLDVLVEKPMASSLEGADRLLHAANKFSRILQIGHLERFNPAVLALEGRVHLPMFFEVHRLSMFSPRSLDVDVVLDLMIHDIDIVLGLVQKQPEEIRAAGISILSEKVDITNVRLQFPGGCVANLTASRVSTDRVRKLRLFQPRQYLSLDYSQQSLVIFTVDERRQVGCEQVAVHRAEPLELQLEAFLDCVEKRTPPKISGETARLSLGVSLLILDKIKEHAEIVSNSLKAGWKW